MKRLIALIALALPLAAQDGFNFSTLDKIGANASKRNNVSLDGDMLKMAAGFLGGKSNADARTLVESLKGVYIRSYEFDKSGMYNGADLEPLRVFLRQGKWNRIVESTERGESSEIYVLPEAGGKLGGVAIIAAEAKELTVVFINGSMRPEDLGKLSGNMGIPNIGNLKNMDKPPAPKKEED